MLDNKATPKYYKQFRDKVLSGEIPICREISMEMDRIDALIANPGVYYDPKAIEGFIAYCEEETTLVDGSDLHLLDSFKLWAEQLLCWFYFIDGSKYIPPETPGGKGRYEMVKRKKRLVNKQVIITARGSAKSMYASLLQSYYLNVDTNTTHQITTGPTMKQSEEVLSPIRTSIVRARGPLMKFLTEGSTNSTSNKMARPKLASTKKGVENFLTNSLLEIRPMSIDKLQGLRCKVASVDEWLSGDIREDVIGAIEQGASKLDDYIILAISSEGTVRNGSGDSIKMELMSILKGEYVNPHISIFFYKLDRIEEVGDADMWMKANPNLGITVSYETYQRDVERAEKVPAARNDILAKRFGIPMEGYTYFFNYEETLCQKRKLNFWGMSCALGADLSQGDDFCAFTFLFPLGDDEFGIKTRSYITENTLSKLPIALRTKYNEFMDEGSLIIMNGLTLDMDEVYEDLDNHIEERQYDCIAFGYDPYNAAKFVESWTRDNGPFGIEKVPQGKKTQTVPLGELKILAEHSSLKFDEQLMQFAMGNCITMEDVNGQRQLLKKRRSEKIDNVAALLDAYVAYKSNKDLF